jgi:hypothetical protein
MMNASVRGKPVVTPKELYHDGCIDLNKTGRKDVFEDSAQPEEKRFDDLIGQMNFQLERFGGKLKGDD